MSKVILFGLSLLVASAALTGCKVEGEVDPDGHVTYSGVLPH